MPDAFVLRQRFFLLLKLVSLLILKFAIRKATTGIDSLYFYGEFNVEAEWAKQVTLGGPDFKQKVEAANLLGYDF